MTGRRVGSPDRRGDLPGRAGSPDDRADPPARPDFRAARNAARHLVEGWAVEAAQQRKLASEYRDHLAWLAAELRSLQRAAGIPEHSCPTCEKSAAAVPSSPVDAVDVDRDDR